MKMSAAVIGSPISHSLSPEIFRFLSERASGIELDYRAVDVGAADLPTKLLEFGLDPSFVGANVTVPHKESIFKIADAVTSLAQNAGAANVVHRIGNKWIAYNTDIYGISESLREAGQSLKDAQVLILGAGGAARAAAVAAAINHARQVHFFNRTYARAASIAEKLASQFPETNFLAHANLSSLHNVELIYSIVIQTTTVGMSGISADAAAEFAPILSALRGRPFGFDLIYRPEQTEFMSQFMAKKCSTMGGLAMLVHQALATWKIWFPQISLPEKTSTDLISHLSAYLKNQSSGQNRIGAKA